MKKACSREEFLTDVWTRYPVLPSTAQTWGRLQNLQRNSTEISFEIEGQKFRSDLSTPEAAFCENQDLVAWDQGKLILLAPFSETAKTESILAQNIHIDFEMQKKWNLFLSSLREFFERKNFIECQTPSLVFCPGTEPTLEVFSTEWKEGRKNKKLFLPTSPELHLKKILAFSQNPRQKIFEITKSYRNSEISQRHQPEFHILEWYRPFEKLESIQKDLIELVHFLKQCFPEDSSLLGSEKHRSFQEIFKEKLNFDLTPRTAAEDLKKLAQQHNLYLKNIESFEDLFNLLYIEKIETQWPLEDLFFIEKFPPSLAALARLDQQGWAERFEFYWQGLEIANAFHELNDPVLQKQRFEIDLEYKRQNGLQEIELDPQFMQALDRGMPPTSGVALGVERLFMALLGISDISKLRMFSWNR